MPKASVDQMSLKAVGSAVTSIPPVSRVVVVVVVQPFPCVRKVVMHFLFWKGGLGIRPKPTQFIGIVLAVVVISDTLVW